MSTTVATYAGPGPPTTTLLYVLRRALQSSSFLHLQLMLALQRICLDNSARRWQPHSTKGALKQAWYFHQVERSGHSKFNGVSRHFIREKRYKVSQGHLKNRSAQLSIEGIVWTCHTEAALWPRKFMISTSSCVDVRWDIADLTGSKVSPLACRRPSL